MLERIKGCFTESIQTQIAAAEALPDAIAHAANILAQALLDDKKSYAAATAPPPPTRSTSPPVC
ncbi:DnaA initiator-associating protein DiaA [Sodalis praecaptivus]